VVRPVITNPPITPPEGEQAGDVKIVSTADESGLGQDASSASGKRPKNDEQDMQQTINTLSNQVERLTDKLGQMQENDRTLLDMERLTRAEQRAEGLRSQLLENESKLADLQSRLEQIEFAIKPENIERANASYGSTRPEEAREARRRQLEKEKALVQNQIRILETGRVRLETAVANADAEVDLLRRRLELKQQERDRAEQGERSTNDRKKPN
jgi:chromosome segregation ATPase